MYGGRRKKRYSIGFLRGRLNVGIEKESVEHLCRVRSHTTKHSFAFCNGNKKNMLQPLHYNANNGFAVICEMEKLNKNK